MTNPGNAAHDILIPRSNQGLCSDHNLPTTFTDIDTLSKLFFQSRFVLKASCGLKTVDQSCKECY